MELNDECFTTIEFTKKDNYADQLETHDAIFTFKIKGVSERFYVVTKRLKCIFNIIESSSKKQQDTDYPCFIKLMHTGCNTIVSHEGEEQTRVIPVVDRW